MNQLTVLTRPDDTAPDIFHVLWANGTQRQGTVTVTVPFDIKDKALAAELGALHHLLVRRAIFGHDRAGVGRKRVTDEASGRESAGAPVELVVSKGQVKKLARGVSADGDTYFALTRWLAVRFDGASIKVAKDTSWLKPRSEMNIEEIVLEPALDDIQPVPSIGEVSVSWHVIDQFSKRFNQLEPSHAWQQFRRLITSINARVSQADEVVERAEMRHGVRGEILYHGESGWNFVIVPGDGARSMPVVATAYWNKRKSHMLEPLARQTA